jgi:hypothetical protein
MSAPNRPPRIWVCTVAANDRIAGKLLSWIVGIARHATQRRRGHQGLWNANSRAYILAQTGLSLRQYWRARDILIELDWAEFLDGGFAGKRTILTRPSLMFMRILEGAVTRSRAREIIAETLRSPLRSPLQPPLRSNTLRSPRTPAPLLSAARSRGGNEGRGGQEQDCAIAPPPTPAGASPGNTLADRARRIASARRPHTPHSREDTQHPAPSSGVAAPPASSGVAAEPPLPSGETVPAPPASVSVRTRIMSRRDFGGQPGPGGPANVLVSRHPRNPPEIVHSREACQAQDAALVAAVTAVKGRGLSGSELRAALLELLPVLEHLGHDLRHPAELHGDRWQGFSAELLVRRYAEYLSMIDRVWYKNDQMRILQLGGARAVAAAIRGGARRNAAQERDRGLLAWEAEQVERRARVVALHGQGVTSPDEIATRLGMIPAEVREHLSNARFNQEAHFAAASTPPPPGCRAASVP